MVTPVVTENVHGLEPVEHDTFIDDFAPLAFVIPFRPRPDRVAERAAPQPPDPGAPAPAVALAA